jgi:hypothetical protein|tara:strand:+ start:181 stop:396 length:216 start_codon:yes stop_codon:yes gene_type:complete
MGYILQSFRKLKCPFYSNFYKSEENDHYNLLWVFQLSSAVSSGCTNKGYLKNQIFVFSAIRPQRRANKIEY